MRAVAVVLAVLAATVGSFAPVAMLGIVILGYRVGSAMHVVISRVEPVLDL